jgi:hypothetical protein
MTFTAADIENRVRVIEKKEQSNSSASTSTQLQIANAQRAAQRNQVASELNANAQLHQMWDQANTFLWDQVAKSTAKTSHATAIAAQTGP